MAFEKEQEELRNMLRNLTDIGNEVCSKHDDRTIEGIWNGNAFAMKVALAKTHIRDVLKYIEKFTPSNEGGDKDEV